MLKHTTAWDRHLEGDETLKKVLINVVGQLHLAKYHNAWISASPCRVLYCMDLDFTLAHGPKGSEGDLECIFFTLNTFQATFLNDIL